MTTSYQRGPQAISRSYYESFWGQFSRVTVTNVEGRAPDRAYATIAYHYKNSGRVDRERRMYGLVREAGQLKISRSAVISPGAG